RRATQPDGVSDARSARQREGSGSDHRVTGGGAVDGVDAQWIDARGAAILVKDRAFRSEGDGEGTHRALQRGSAQLFGLAFVDEEQVDLRHWQTHHRSTWCRIQ